MKEWSDTWHEIEERTKKIAHECENFDMEVPTFGDFIVIDTELQESVKIWKIFDEYNDELLITKEINIKELAARASGEVTMREALTELKQWCDESDFEMTDYTSGEKTVPLIKEWKDMLTKVSDN